MFKQMAESASNLHKAVDFTLKILFPPGGKTTKAQQQALQSLALLVASEEVLQKGAMHEPEKRAFTAQCVKNWCAQILQHKALVNHVASVPAKTTKLAVFTDIKLTNPYDPDPATATLIERIKKLKAAIRNKPPAALGWRVEEHGHRERDYPFWQGPRGGASKPALGCVGCRGEQEGGRQRKEGSEKRCAVSIIQGYHP